MNHLLAFVATVLILACTSFSAQPSLVPATPSTAPDYFCTWNLQGFVSSYTNPNDQADAMTEANLFGKGPNQDWVEMYPDARADLILVLDDTWDIPLGPREGKGHAMRGSMELDNQRFPSYTGTPAERLAKLNRDVRAHGWRSVGLWVHSGRAKARMDPKIGEEEYWAERMRWCRDAGIDYWKVDWGAMADKDVWRLNQWAWRAYPGLWIEHGGGAKVTGERVWMADKLGVWRTYDVNPSAAVPETIRRVAVALRYAREDNTAGGLINCEDEPYIGAGLGCVYGVMRHPLVGNMPNGQPDRWFRPEFRDLKHRLDEITRAVRWHRIAQPFGIGGRDLIDTALIGASEKHIGVPARIARGGLPLPTVSAAVGQQPPFVLCSRHPDGEIAIVTVGSDPQEMNASTADITLDIGALNRPIGIFGRYSNLTLLTSTSLAGHHILAQDLAGKTPVDISDEVKISAGRLTIPGAVINRVGLMAAKPAEISDPGMLLVVDGLTQFIPKQPMKPFLREARPVPVGKPGEGLKIVRAMWGPTSGGDDVTAPVAAMVKGGGLKVEAYPDVFNKTNPSTYQRLEVEYTCQGKGFIAIANYGERLIIDPAGNYRTERAQRKEPDLLSGPLGPSTQANIALFMYKEKNGARSLIISKRQGGPTWVVITADRGRRLLAVTGPSSTVSPSEYAVTGFNSFSDMEERIEIKTAEDGSVQLKRASLPFPETITFVKPAENGK